MQDAQDSGPSDDGSLGMSRHQMHELVARQTALQLEARLIFLSPERAPRPPNAFMLFAITWRRRIASAFPNERNSSISIRLGNNWKNLPQEEKEAYYTVAHELEVEHSKQFPGYVYSPVEARQRKAKRAQQRNRKATDTIQKCNESMLKGRGEGGAGGGSMLQSYGDVVSEPLGYYHQIAMPPAAQTPEYSISTPPWYNTHTQGGMGGGDEYYRGKTPEWTTSAYQDSSDPPPAHYVPPTPDNSVCSSSTEGQYHGLVEGLALEGQSLLLGGLTDASPPAPLLPPNPPTPADSLLSLKDGDPIGKIEQKTSKVEEGTKKLPGFHQTFGTITEIGRFSQHDDYFESRPDEAIAPVKDLTNTMDNQDEEWIVKMIESEMNTRRQTKELIHLQNSTLFKPIKDFCRSTISPDHKQKINFTKRKLLSHQENNEICFGNNDERIINETNFFPDFLNHTNSPAPTFDNSLRPVLNFNVPSSLKYQRTENNSKIGSTNCLTISDKVKMPTWVNMLKVGEISGQSNKNISEIQFGKKNKNSQFLSQKINQLQNLPKKLNGMVNNVYYKRNESIYLPETNNRMIKIPQTNSSLLKVLDKTLETINGEGVMNILGKSSEVINIQEKRNIANCEDQIKVMTNIAGKVVGISNSSKVKERMGNFLSKTNAKVCNKNDGVINFSEMTDNARTINISEKQDTNLRDELANPSNNYETVNIAEPESLIVNMKTKNDTFNKSRIINCVDPGKKDKVLLPENEIRHFSDIKPNNLIIMKNGRKNTMPGVKYGLANTSYTVKYTEKDSMLYCTEDTNEILNISERRHESVKYTKIMKDYPITFLERKSVANNNEINTSEMKSKFVKINFSGSVDDCLKKRCYLEAFPTKKVGVNFENFPSTITISDSD